MRHTKTTEPVNEADGNIGENPVLNLENDQLLSAATELCLIYLECEKIIKKHEEALGPDCD